MKYYHATRCTNAISIVQDGVIRTGCDGIVYLADSMDNAFRFIAVRTFHEDVIVFEIDIPETEMKFVEETFDHSYNFFQCKAFGYSKNIPTSWITDVMQFGQSR